ncbi:23S rRNA pseudouridine(2604) synthase RluF, partial [Salmonella enterica subsp. enterica]|nr:23S rRNA pseudouridine(2604) synthase RluF [Salmonella enterica subsp. enterica]
PKKQISSNAKALGIHIPKTKTKETENNTRKRFAQPGRKKKKR